MERSATEELNTPFPLPPPVYDEYGIWKIHDIYESDLELILYYDYTSLTR